MIRLELRLKGLENPAKRLGAALLNGGGNVVHKVSVCDWGLSRGVIRKRSCIAWTQRSGKFHTQTSSWTKTQKGIMMTMIVIVKTMEIRGDSYSLHVQEVNPLHKFWTFSSTLPKERVFHCQFKYASNNLWSGSVTETSSPTQYENNCTFFFFTFWINRANNRVKWIMKEPEKIERGERKSSNLFVFDLLCVKRLRLSSQENGFEA